MNEQNTALTVSDFLKTLNNAFEEALFPYGAVVEGEVVEYRVSQGKWIWFSLKDEKGLLSCFATVWQLKQPLEDGMMIRAHGMPKIHQKSGRFSLTVDSVEMVGEGALQRAFQLLKKKLQQEGVFAPERKRPLPEFPQRIGLIASTESAAYSDFLRILGDRWGGMDILSAHVQVQGKDAVEDIVGAFRYFNDHPDAADVLVLTRGGGSMEDLHAFNDEAVARAVFGSKIPVIVGVGHERDESLAEYAADVRASTPSNAAERLVPDRRDIERQIDAMSYTMESIIGEDIARYERRLYEFESTLERHVQRERSRFDELMYRLKLQFSKFENGLQVMISEIDGDLRLLQSLDPKAVLKRGYSIARDENGKIIHDAKKVDKGTTVSVQLHKGKLHAEVK